MSFKGKCAIAGLGMTPMGQVYDFDGMGFAIEAVRLALEDAGLKPADLDGLLVQPGVAWRESAGGLSWMANTEMQELMGLRDLRLIATMNLGGATAGAMVAYAAQSIANGMANAVACVFADNPLEPPTARPSESTAATACSAPSPAMGWSPGATWNCTARSPNISAPSRLRSANGPT